MPHLIDRTGPMTDSEIRIEVQGATLQGVLIRSARPAGVVIFAHGSGSSHRSPRNQAIARMLAEHGFHALLSDLLTDEEAEHLSNRFDMRLLSHRLNQITRWMTEQPEARDLPIAYFGASTGAAAALASAVDQPRIKTVISRGGRPDLVLDLLERVRIPVLLIVGELDFDVLRLNRQALNRLKGVGQMHVVPGATHLFPEPGALDHVGDVSLSWFNRHLRIRSPNHTASPPSGDVLPGRTADDPSAEAGGGASIPSSISDGVVAPPTSKRPTHP